MLQFEHLLLVFGLSRTPLRSDLLVELSHERVLTLLCVVNDLLPRQKQASVLALPMALSSAVFYRRPNIANARRVFFGSLLYLPAFQVLAVAHRVPRTETKKRSALDELVAFRVPANPWAWTAWSATGWQAWADEGHDAKQKRTLRVAGEEGKRGET